MSGQVDLIRAPNRGWNPPGKRPIVVTRSLPLYRGKALRCRYVHRIRSALLYLHDNPGIWKTKSHIGYHFWCGSIGSNHKGQATANLAATDVICATCEGRAVGAGQPSLGLVKIHPVKFTPRGS